MARLGLVVALLVCMAATRSASAQSGRELEAARGCPACHAATQTKIGPSYKEIASRHRNDPATVDKLTAMLREGKVHPRASATDAELRAIVTFVLSAR